MKTFTNALGVLCGLMIFLPTNARAEGSACDSIPQSAPEFDHTTQRFKGCRLLEVEPGSRYAKLGLKKGSILFPTKGPAAQGQEIKPDTAASEPAAGIQLESTEKEVSRECSKRGKGCTEIREDFFDAQ